MKETVLELKGVSKRYNEKIVVDHVNLKVKRGEAIGLLGPNGAGKSTIIKMIVGAVRPTIGQVYLLGEESEKGLKAARKRIGFVPQELALYSDLKVWENLELFGGLYGLTGNVLKRSIEEVIEMVDLSQQRENMVNKLSEGMKRRLNMACALIHLPELLIFDEPTVAIDPQSRRFILQKIKMLNEKGCTVLYTSHYIDEVEALCNRIAILEKGKLIACGTKDELIDMVTAEEELSLEEVFIRLTGKEFRIEE